MDGVLNVYDVARRLATLSSWSGKSTDEIWRDLWESGFEDDADAGCYRDAAVYLAEFARRLEYPLTRDEWIFARKAAIQPRPLVLGWAEQLADQAMVALLTNNGPLLASSFAEVFPDAARLFAGQAYFSYQFGTKKPELRIFRDVCARMGMAPRDCLFIDDKVENVEGARAAGLHGHHFVDEAGLKACLISHGLSVG